MQSRYQEPDISRCDVTVADSNLEINAKAEVSVFFFFSRGQ